MNFVCDKCKQKYHVADEKIRGRAVTRFRCKKCENVIELRSDALPDPDAPGAPRQAESPDDRPRPATMAPSAPRPAVTAISGGAIGATAAKLPPRTRAATSVGVAFNAGMAASVAKPAPRTASTSAILNASETGWYAGIRDLPVGPLTRKELVAKVQSAEVTPDTLVWREGLDDWRPLRNVAELGDVLRLGAQRISGSLLDEMGRRTPSAPSPAPAEPRRTGQVVPLRQPLATPNAPAVTRPAINDDDDEEEATRVTGMDPAIAALIPKALGLEPRPAKAPVEAEDGGDQTLIEPPHSPVGRSLGLDGNKGGLRAPVAKAPPPKAPTPAPPARPAPPKAPQSFNQPKGSNPPATPAVAEKAASVPPAAMTIESSPSLGVSSAPPPAPLPSDVAPAPAPLSSLPPEDGDLPEDLFGRKPFPPQSNAPSLESFGLSAAFSSSMPPPSSMPAPALAPMALAPPAPTSLAPVAQAPSKQGGLSLPVIILMLGVLVLGVFGGVVLAGRLNRPITQPVPAPVRVVQPTAAPVVEPPVPAAPGPEVAVVPSTEPGAVDPAPTAAEPNGVGGHAHTGHRVATAAPRESGGTISAAQAAANARAVAAALGQGGPSGGPVNTTRLPSQNNGAQENSPGLTGSARAGRAVQNFNSARIVNTCWQNLLRMNPSVQPVRVSITLQIGASGRITRADIPNSPDPRFTQCINSRVGGVQPVSPGEAMGAELSVSLTTGG